MVRSPQYDADLLTIYNISLSFPSRNTLILFLLFNPPFITGIYVRHVASHSLHTPLHHISPYLRIIPHHAAIAFSSTLPFQPGPLILPSDLHLAVTRTSLTFLTTIDRESWSCMTFAFWIRLALHGRRRYLQGVFSFVGFSDMAFFLPPFIFCLLSVRQHIHMYA